MKSQLDERQVQEAARVAGISFCVMYMVCAISIVVQLAAAGHPKNVIGETIALLAGGSVYLIGSVKKASIQENLAPLYAFFWKAQVFPLYLQFFMPLPYEKKPDQKQRSALLFFSFLQGLLFSAFSH